MVTDDDLRSTITARIGVHNALDPTSTANVGNRRTDNVIATGYKFGLGDNTANPCQLRIAAWTPLTNLNGGDPLSGVLRSHKGGELVFWSSSRLRPGWAKNVREAVRLKHPVSRQLLSTRCRAEKLTTRTSVLVCVQVGDRPLTVAIAGGVGAPGPDEQVPAPVGVVQHDDQESDDKQERQKSGHGKNHASE